MEETSLYITVFPAPAGMNRDEILPIKLSLSVPCARRDEPVFDVGDIETAAVFPAPAGMNRLTPPGSPSNSSVPCARRDEPLG